MEALRGARSSYSTKLGHALQCMSTYAGFLKLVSCADVLNGISLRMCRQCTAVSHHIRMHISIPNLSNAPLYTYELCFNYMDSMLLMQFPSAPHWQNLLPSTGEQGRDRACAERILQYNAYFCKSLHLHLH